MTYPIPGATHATRHVLGHPMQPCVTCDLLGEALREAIRVQERRRARSIPLDLTRIEQIKAKRAAHRRSCRRAP